MEQRVEGLNHYLSRLRREAGLSVADVCLRTKIQARFVEDLEAGRWGEVPSNTHLRAFSMAIAKACGGDEAQASTLARLLLAASAPVAGTEAGICGFDTPPPPPTFGRNLPPPAGPQETAPEGQRPVFAAAGTGSRLEDASLRLRALPLGVLLGFLAAAGALSYGAVWSVGRWRQRENASILGTQVASAPAPSSSAAQALTVAAGGPGPQPTFSPQDVRAVAAALDPASATASVGVATGPQLVLRARRPCWLVLEIDGKRLPTVTMRDGDKLKWTVTDRAVLLAGNVGALRIWWQGDNDGYLGALDRRANGLVFERGHEPHLDPAAALPLPPGIE